MEAKRKHFMLKSSKNDTIVQKMFSDKKKLFRDEREDRDKALKESIGYPSPDKSDFMPPIIEAQDDSALKGQDNSIEIF